MEDITSKTIEQAAVCLDNMAKQIRRGAFVTVGYHVGIGWGAEAYLLNDGRTSRGEGATALEAMNALCRLLKARIDRYDNLAKTLGVAA